MKLGSPVDALLRVSAHMLGVDRLGHTDIAGALGLGHDTDTLQRRCASPEAPRRVETCLRRSSLFIESETLVRSSSPGMPAERTDSS